jgi:hypothetical protein
MKALAGEVCEVGLGFAMRRSARTLFAELLVLCARIGFNP